jgi:hypothetical protein
MEATCLPVLPQIPTCSPGVITSEISSRAKLPRVADLVVDS